MQARADHTKRLLLSSPDACKYINTETNSTNHKRAWVTAVANNKYLLPTLVLSRTLDLYSCVKKKIAIVNNDPQQVSESTKRILEKAGFEVLALPNLDCHIKGVKPVNDIATFPGEYLRLYAWTFTNYEKVIYLDCDVMLLDNVDELFEYPLADNQIAASYFEEPGIVDSGINSGLLVIKPREEEFQTLLREWRALFKVVGCVADQPFLWLFYNQAGRILHMLPYSYNVRKRVYYPLRIWHFAGPLREGFKPWAYPHTQAESYMRPIVKFSDVVATWWYFLYEAVKQYQLENEEWWTHELKNLLSKTSR